MDHQQQRVRREPASSAVVPDAARIGTIFKDCLYQEGEDTTNHVEAEGITVTVGFHPERLASHKQEIVEELADLPDEFRIDSDAHGWSFLNACLDKEGNQWGEHVNVQELLLLGLAAGKITYLAPRKLWEIMPGGMPYFAVHE